MNLIIFMIWLAAVLVSLTVYLRKVYSRFSRYGVKYIKPVPFVGNVGSVALKKSHMVEIFQNLYSAFPNERFVGRFELMTPVIMIRDLDLIKQITVKDFEHFIDHRSMVDETVDPLFGRNLFSLKGQEWKDMRSTLSPAFTGSKMRAMVPFMVGASDQMIKKLKMKMMQSDSDFIDIDSKDLMTRYTNDVMASCGFGLNVDSHTDSDNEFYLHAKSTAHLSLRRILVFLGYSSFPNIMKKLNIKLFNEEANEYFKNLFSDTILERERKKTFRPDIIHLLLEAKKGNLKHVDKDQYKDAGFATVEESEVGKSTVNRTWSDTDLVAQAILFFLASFETISTAMCFLLYELAVAPEVQDRLVKELRDSDAKNKGFDYNSIQNLKYLDMVVSELLRIWPVGVGIDRLCTKNYSLGKPNEQSTNDYIIKKGELVLVPTWPIHRDPNYFPDPEKFDPERFSEENRANIKPYTYMPFGSGPRSCVASRFALSEMKVVVYHLLLQFEVSPAEKTRIPVKLVPGAVLLSMEGGHWVRFRSRM